MSYVGALGAASITDPRVAFQEKYTALELQVQLALQHMLARGAPAGVLTTMSNNIQSMQRVAARVMAGETAKMADVARVGGAIIDEARAYGPSNLPTLESLVKDIASLPAKFNSTVQAVARAAGKTVNTVLTEAGVDPQLALQEASSAVKYGAIAAVALAAIYLARK